MRCLEEPILHNGFKRCNRCKSTWGDSYGGTPECAYRPKEITIKPIVTKHTVENTKPVDDVLNEHDVFFNARYSKPARLRTIFNQ